MSWGAELWDKYEDLCRYSSTSIDFLENSVADFIKERGKVEKEYAKSLRALVKKYTPKTVNSDKNSSGPQSLRFEDEFSHLEAYKEVRIKFLYYDSLDFLESVFTEFYVKLTLNNKVQIRVSILK